MSCYCDDMTVVSYALGYDSGFSGLGATTGLSHSWPTMEEEGVLQQNNVQLKNFK